MITAEDAVLHVRRYISTIGQTEHMTKEDYEAFIPMLVTDLQAWEGQLSKRTPLLSAPLRSKR